MTYVDRARSILVEELTARQAACEGPLVELYLLLVFVRQDATSLEDVHDAWSVWTSVRRPGHRSLVPFAELSREVQDLDEPYRAAIVATAERLAAEGTPA